MTYGPEKTLKELLTGLKGAQVCGDDRLTVPSLAYHSGKVAPGGVFVALKGAKTDGHRFISQALARGAKAVVTEEVFEAPAGVTVVRVPEARLALAHLSCAFYGHPSQELVLVGITGTNGKTTTSFLLEAILRAAGHRVGVVGTVNYRVGDETWPAPVTTPESLDLQRLLRQMRERGVSHAVIEVSSHALMQHRVDASRFAAGVFTNLSQDHLDYHHDLDEYFHAKSRLFFRVLRNGGGHHGLSVLNLDDPWGRQLHTRVEGPKLSYGHDPESTVRPLSFRYQRHGLAGGPGHPRGGAGDHLPPRWPLQPGQHHGGHGHGPGAGGGPGRGADCPGGACRRARAPAAAGAGRGAQYFCGLRPHPGCPGPGAGRAQLPGLWPHHHRVRLRRRPG